MGVSLDFKNFECHMNSSVDTSYGNGKNKEHASEYGKGHTALKSFFQSEGSCTCNILFTADSLPLEKKTEKRLINKSVFLPVCVYEFHA